MSTPTPLEELIGHLIYARSGWGAWAHGRGLSDPPQWARSLEVAGALARMPEYMEPVPMSESEVRARARSLLRRRGDAGWSSVIETMLGCRPRSGTYWLVEKRSQWPAALATWPEERVRTMAFAMRMDEELTLPNAVALFETVERRSELRLARWLTGRTWAKGSRMLEVMEAAELTAEGSPRHVSQLWRQLAHDQRSWLTQDLVAVIDGEYRKDLWTWFRALDQMRAVHAPRT